MKRLFILVAVFAAAACAKTGNNAATTADAADVAAKLQSGTTVCLSEVAGVRYQLEDKLREQDLTPDNSCTAADVQLEEQGEPTAWVMRYQRAGDADWKECKSDKSDREVFAETCIAQMIADLGGS